MLILADQQYDLHDQMVAFVGRDLDIQTKKLLAAHMGSRSASAVDQDKKERTNRLGRRALSQVSASCDTLLPLRQSTSAQVPASLPTLPSSSTSLDYDPKAGRPATRASAHRSAQQTAAVTQGGIVQGEDSDRGASDDEKEPKGARDRQRHERGTVGPTVEQS